jgi:DNA-binding NarL/FixJ family response regulator
MRCGMTFTPAEQRALPLLTQPEKVAAHRLGVSQSAFKYHKTNIIRKTGTANLCSAVAKLSTQGQAFECFEART